MTARFGTDAQASAVALRAVRKVSPANSADHTDGGTSAGEAEHGAIYPGVSVLIAKPPARLALASALLTLTALAGLIGYQGFHTYSAAQDQERHASLLEAGRESAARLTSISPDQVEAEVEQILALSTGLFYQDFQQRSPSLIEMVQQAQAKTEGTVIEAGLEAIRDNGADVLVAVSVKTTLAGAEAPARVWRIRIGIERVDETEKVSHVEYVA